MEQARASKQLLSHAHRVAADEHIPGFRRAPPVSGTRPPALARTRQAPAKISQVFSARGSSKYFRDRERSQELA